MGFGPRPSLAWALILASLACACAGVAPLPPATPEVPLAAWESGIGAKPEPSSATGMSSSAESSALAKSGPLPVAKPPASDAKPAAPGPKPRTASSPIVGGAGCLAELTTRGVRFSRSEPVLGVATPIVVEGPISGVRFYTLEKKPLVVDCRLALALSEIASDLRALGVSEARYSGAYVYRTSHPGRMSLHAYGLAIDLHEFKVSGQSFVVKTAFEKGRACASDLPLLNQLACRVRERHLFHEQLGPDDNAAHYDHFHLGLRPLPEEVAADLPWPTAPPPRRASARPKLAHGGSIPEAPPNGSRKVSARARTEPERHAR